MSIMDKTFWESKHKSSDKYWLTGSDLNDIKSYHNLTNDDFVSKKILEIGVGLGTLSEQLADFTNRLICCDISDEALKNVHHTVYKKYLTTNLKNIEPVDTAICHLVFQHCDDDEVFRIIKEVNLTEDGVFTFQFAYLRENEKPSNKVVELIENGSHHFRSLNVIEDMVNKSNKKIIWVSQPYDFFKELNFSWLVVKIKNNG